MKRLLSMGVMIASVVMFAWSVMDVAAFSPYEELISQGKTTYVGLLAAAKPGKGADLDKALKDLTNPVSVATLRRHGISNLSVHKKVLTDKQTWYWVYFDYRGKNYLKAGNAFEKAAAKTAEFVQPHPRAAKYGVNWLQMEWICYLPALRDDKLPTQKKVGIVTRIKPEKEEQYRTLHQTVWPGVSDQLVRSNNRNLSVFLVEIGNEIYEFLYLEYVGKDAEADDLSSKADPCTLRWWKLTDACQLPLPDVKEGIWSGMDAVVE